MPVLIAVFAVGAYAYGIALRGLDVVINEVAIVRGAPDAEEGTAQVYLGVFSPSQGTYQLDLPGGALIASTLTGDFATGSTAPLDIVQGNPSRVRNLTVGFGSLRTLRAETPAAVPRIRTDLRLADGMLVGTVRNLSDQVLERPAIVLGGSVVVLADLAPGGEQSVALPIKPNPFDQSLADRILGPLFFGDPSRGDDTTRRDEARHYVIEQLTFDPTFSSIGRLPSEGPVLLAWGSRQVLDVRVDGLVPRRTGNVLYYIPLDMAIDGRTTFEADLLRSSIVEIDSLFFSKDPYSMHVGSGSVTIAYRPIAFTGSLEPRRVLLSMGFGDRQGLDGGPPVPIEPTTGPEPPAEGAPPGQPAPDEPACDPNTEDCVGAAGLPEVEVHDRTGNGGWVRLPHFSVGTVYELADPVRYVDPSTGAILVRFSDEDQDGSSFSFQIRIEGQVE
jgi:hypothetical protein